MTKMKQSKRIALCAIMSALGTLILFLGAVVDIFSLTAAAVASLLISVTMIEVGSFYPWLVWGVTSALSLILLPNKLPAIMYFVLCGFYPIVKKLFEKLPRVLAWVCKLGLFNASLLSLIYVSKHIFYLNDMGFDFTIPVIIVGNLALVMYDIALSRLVLYYVIVLRRRMGLDKRNGS